MNEIIKNNNKKFKKIEEERKTFSAIALAWELGYIIVIPIVALALIGRLLDKHFDTSPWLLLLGILISIIISSYSVYCKTTEIIEDLNKTNKK